MDSRSKQVVEPNHSPAKDHRQPESGDLQEAAPLALGDGLTRRNITALQRLVGNQAVMRMLRQAKTEQHATKESTVSQQINRETRESIQRAIGLEIEVSVPVDQLTAGEEQNIQNAAGNDPNAIPRMPPFDVMGLRKRAVAYTRGNGPKPTNGEYRAEVDHDPRVNTEKDPAFPYRDMNNSALLEIVTEPKSDKAAFDAAMDDVDAFVADVDTRTNNLTTHAHDPYGSGHNIGPIDYPALGPMPRQPNHNWKGSVQVNIGIDMREYASLAKWYAKSGYADPSKAEKHNKGDFKKAKDNILKAVDIGRSVTESLSKPMSKADRAAMGNLRGIRGWVTHMALYMLGGKEGLPEGSTAKNITPILMKSSNEIGIEYAMTPDELAYYQDDAKRAAIVVMLIAKTGRKDLDPNDPLGGSIVKGKADQGTLAHLSADANVTLFAGAPIAGEQPVGPARTGEGADQTPNTAGGERGGAVVEFRNLPGFHEGPDAWRQLGYDFLREAENRNKRGGSKPDKLSKLQSDDWG